MVGQVHEYQTAEDIILEEGFSAGLASILEGIQEIQDYATDAIFPADACGKSLCDEERSLASTTYSLTDASTATGSRSLGKSVSWYDDEINVCNVEVEVVDGTKKRSSMKNLLSMNKKLSLNVMPSGKRSSRNNKKATKRP
jgi:uncharacterized protein with LGFP repeats